jgi:hypothetical protein
MKKRDDFIYAIKYAIGAASAPVARSSILSSLVLLKPIHSRQAARPAGFCQTLSLS